VETSEAAKNWLLNFETAKNKNFLIISEQTSTACSGPEWRHRQKTVSGLFQINSGRPEDWTVSGPCHLYLVSYPKALRK